mmetsp:Transcript_15468/g.29847  ORF Transcript_15468/g.29847 Transcript_15468/m.29847 type:complete len:200 (+) Transcript_15468:303-902(+)
MMQILDQCQQRRPRVRDTEGRMAHCALLLQRLLTGPNGILRCLVRRRRSWWGCWGRWDPRRQCACTCRRRARVGRRRRRAASRRRGGARGGPPPRKPTPPRCRPRPAFTPKHTPAAQVSVIEYPVPGAPARFCRRARDRDGRRAARAKCSPRKPLRGIRCQETRTSPSRCLQPRCSRSWTEASGSRIDRGGWAVAIATR